MLRGRTPLFSRTFSSAWFTTTYRIQAASNSPRYFVFDSLLALSSRLIFISPTPVLRPLLPIDSFIPCVSATGSPNVSGDCPPLNWAGGLLFSVVRTVVDGDHWCTPSTRSVSAVGKQFPPAIGVESGFFNDRQQGRAMVRLPRARGRRTAPLPRGSSPRRKRVTGSRA